MKDLTVKVGEREDAWDDFVRRSPQGSIFLISNFLNTMSIKYELLTCYDRDKIIAGAVIFFDENDVPLQTPNRFIIYQGLLLSDNSALELHSRLSYEFKVTNYFLSNLTDRYDRFCFTNSWKLFDLRPFQWLNYHAPEKGQFNILLRYTGLLPLTRYANFEDYVGTIRELRRRELRKANNNIIIKPTNNVDLFLKLHDMTYKRQGIAFSKEVFQYRSSIVKGALEGGYGKMACARTKEGQVASVIFFIYDTNTAYYVFGANNPEERKSGASTALMLFFIRDALERGFKWVDFFGVNSPNRGDYKISFNAALRPYFITTYRKGIPRL